jgi:two-component system sensor histidine kinase KdpD
MKTELEIDPLEDDFLDWVAEKGKAVASSRREEQRVSGSEEIVRHSSIFRSVSRNDVFLPVPSSSRIEGILHVGGRRSRKPYSLNEVQLLFAAARMAGTFLERKRLDEAARQAETLKEGDKLKSAIFSSVSHELKTPLSSMTATVSGLLDERADLGTETVRRELGSIQKDLDRLTHSISSLLDLSRLAAEAWHPDLQWVEPGEILGWVVYRLDRHDRERVRMELPEGLPLVQVDFQQWGRMLMHVIENALAYSPPGSPVVVSTKKTSEGLETWISDEGPGIPDGEKEKAFIKFYRGSFSNLLPGGTGLGLPIAREIARVHGGEIRLENNSPKGTRVVIVLPPERIRDMKE